MSGPDIPQQIPLDLVPKPGFSREDFIASRSNQAALEIIERWPNWPSSVVVLAGPAGSGKSHLAAIWAEKSRAARLGTGEDVLSLEAGLHDAAVLIEDVGARPIDEVAMFHLLNSLRETGGSILLTSRSLPREWGLKLPDLLSRMQSATLVEIAEPDDAMLASVIAKLFADRQVNVDANVVSFLVARMERSLAAAVDIVGRLDRMALERQVRITRALAANVVTDDDPRQSELDF